MGLSWTPGIGDPTFTGWLTVVAYFVAAWWCLQAFMSEKSGPRRPYLATIAALSRVFRKHFPSVPAPARRAGVWLLFSVCLGALGVNKQLDLQTLLTDIGRVLAHHQGWYEERHLIQKAFILAMGCFSLAAAASLAWFLRGHLRDFRFALLGFCILLGFVLMRAASFHGMDHFIGVQIIGVRMNALFELGGITIVGIAAQRRSKQASV